MADEFYSKHAVAKIFEAKKLTVKIPDMVHNSSQMDRSDCRTINVCSYSDMQVHPQGIHITLRHFVRAHTHTHTPHLRPSESKQPP